MADLVYNTEDIQQDGGILAEHHRMAQAVANVARRINETMEEGRDCLDLSDCDLISFPDGIFKMLRSCTDNIHKITLANNQIKALSNKFFHTFSQLRDLDVQGNVLTSLPDAVGDVEHLISINLSKNRLAVFPERLTRVKSLQNINVEGNQITELPMEKLSLMSSLKSLDVRSNPLTTDTESVPHHFSILT